VKSVADKFLVNGIDSAHTAVLGTPKEWVNKESGWDIRDLHIQQGNGNLIEQDQATV